MSYININNNYKSYIYSVLFLFDPNIWDFERINKTQH